ncbi:hypothetical protein Tco_0556188 [Tanacetum coccineum]
MVPPDSRHISPEVYHKRRPTLGLLILPFVSPFSPTIRRTTRISFLPTIEPNLAERARISAINLDDYQLDLVTPPPSPSSPFTMGLIKDDYGNGPHRRGRSSNCLRDGNWLEFGAFEKCLLEALSVDELIDQLRQMCQDAEDCASNAQEEARQKRKEALKEVVQQIYRNNN